MILLIDNYDSFTFNLVHRLGEVGARRIVSRRNDALTVDQALDLKPEPAEAFVLSPGPCTPDDAGICLELCRKSPIPLLGVCLGHQSLAQAFGARIVRAQQPMHGKTSPIFHQGEGLFSGLISPIDAARYHSLVIDPDTLPDCFAVHARTEDNTIMAIAHRELPLYGLQFHPESIASPEGFSLLRNFLTLNQLEPQSRHE